MDASSRDAAWTFWQERLAWLDQRMQIGATVRGRAGSSRPRRCERMLDLETTRTLLRLVRGDELGVFVELLAALSLLLIRYTGCAASVVRAPPAEGRGAPIPFIQLRSNDATLSEWLVRMRETALQSCTYGPPPRELLDGQPPGHALTAVALSYAPLHREWDGDGAALHFTARLDGELLVLALVHDEARFDAGFAARCLDHWARILSAFRDVRQPLGGIDLLSPEERVLVTEEFCESRERRADPRSIVACFAEQVARASGARAVVFGHRHTTYAELDRRSTQLAWHLRRARGVQTGACVGLYGPPSDRMILAILAILKAGAVYVPLERSAPPARLAAMIRRCAIETLLVDGDVEPREWFAGHVLRLGETSWDDEPADATPVLPEPSDLAYVMFTSGSTGEPKGVRIEHRSVVRVVKQNHYCEPGPRDRLLQASNLAFDGSVFEIFGALLNGAELHVAPPGTRESPVELCAFIRERGINIAFVTTALFNRIVEVDPTVLGGFDRLYFGGQDASLKHVRAGFPHAKAPGALVHVYGPTETTVFATYFPILELPGEDELLPIGRPIGQTRVHVLDSELRPSPLGVPGELVIGGAGVARGYLEMPSLTAEKFIADPLRPGELVYRTGDIGRFRLDGNLEFLGRRDDLVKIRGYRIELGEIEAALRACPTVAEAVVVATDPGSDGDRELVAYVQTNTPTDEAALRERLRVTLPAYMVPARLRFVRFALTPNGKIDRRRLPAVEDPATDRGFIAPVTRTEVRLAALWEGLLDRRPVSAADDFFDVGGHSLKAAQLATLVHRELHVEIGLRDVFLRPTLAELAAHLDTLGRSRCEPIPPAPPTADHPLSQAQRHLWIVSRIEGSSSVYHIPEGYEIRGPLDAAALRRAFAEVVRRHEALRTRFFVRDGEPRQQIVAGFDVPWTEVELEGDDPQAALLALAFAEGRAPFDLADGSPVRATLVRCASERHVLFLTLHHIAGDGASLGVFLRDLAALYRAGTLGEGHVPPPLPVQYKDFVYWQAARLAGEESAVARDYWRRRLAGLSVIGLPADFPRPASRTFAGARMDVSFGAAARDGLLALARRAGGTLFMTVLALVKVLLHRYTGECDITVGAPIAGRDHADLDDLVGLFADILVLRDTVSGDESFVDLLARLRKTVLDAHEHRLCSFDSIVEQLHLARSSDRHPLFDVIVSLHDRRLSGITLGERLELAPGLDLERLATRYDVSRFDLAFGFVDAGEDLLLHVEFSTELYLPARIERMLGHLRTLVESALAAPDAPVARLRILPDPERALLDAWSMGPPPTRASETLVDAILAQAEAAPERVALVDGEGELRYGELRARATALAALLVERHGVAPGDRVGIAVDRTNWAAVAVLGIWLAGAAFLPVDPTQAPARVTEILQQARTSVVLTRGAVILPAGVHGLDLASVESFPIVRTPSRPGPSDTAYVLFTTGSTGVPKGVEVEHRQIANWTFDQAALLGVGPDDRVLQFFSVQFDPALFFLCLGLAAGARVVVASPSVVEDPRHVERLLEEENITILGTTPGYLGLLRPELHRVRAIVTGGEAPSVRDVSLYGRGRRFVNQYGPTEATCTTCYWTDGLAEDASVVPIGRPLAGVCVDLLDARRELVPIGVPGEIAVSGAGVARGYLGMPAATAERFVETPHRPGMRTHLTGDWALWREDGQLQFLGRRDHQVKVRGYRVELDAIAEVLLSLPGIRQALVLREGEESALALVAYLESDAPPAEAALRGAVRDALPHYMMPSRFVVVPSFPLTANGKFDRDALQRFGGEARLESREDLTAVAGIEAEVLAIYREVLGRPIGVSDEFFDAGGSSLAATQVAARLRDRLGARIALRDVFTHTSPRALAGVMRERAGTGQPSMHRAPEAAHYPLSHPQLGMWVSDQAAAERWALNISGIYRWDGALDRWCLERTLATVVARHEVLRTIFELVDGEVRQRVVAPMPICAPLVELDGEDSLHALAVAETRKPFDLARGPLLRVTPVKLGSEEYRLLVVMHHIVSDGWSMRLLLEEVEQVYRAFAEGREDPLPLPSLQYKDYAVWQRDMLAGEEGQRLRAYWRERLRGTLPRTRLPPDRPLASGGTAGDVVSLPLAEELTAGLASLGAAQGTSPFMTLFAAILVLMHGRTGETEMLLGFPSAGRDHPALERSLGFFINPLPLRAEVDPSGPFTSLLAAVRRDCVDAYEHQRYPFDRIAEDAAQGRERGRAQLFEMGFTWATAGPGASVLDRFEEVLVAAKADLWFHASERGRSLTIDIEYRTSLYARTTIERLAASLREVLERIVATPGDTVAALAGRGSAPGGPSRTRYAW